MARAAALLLFCGLLGRGLLGCGAAADPGAPIERVVVREAAGEDAPLVVLLHGRGSTPERFGALLGELPFDARVVALRAPIAEHDGRAWFVFRFGGARAREDLLALVPRALAAIDAEVRDHPPRAAPILVGFSQGGMLAYELGFARPRGFAMVVPVSAVVLGPGPRRMARWPRFRALHGTDDPVIDIASHREDVDALRRAGADAELVAVERTGHWLDPRMRAALIATLAEPARR